MSEKAPTTPSKTVNKAPAPTKPKAPELKRQTVVAPLHPAFPDKSPQTTLDKASRLTKKGAEVLIEKAPHSFIGDLSAKLQRTGLNILNKPVLAVYQKLYQWRSGKAAKAEATFLAKKSLLTGLEARVKQIDESAKKVQAGGMYTPKLAAKMDKERNALLLKVEKAKAQHDSAQLVLESKNNKKAHWENKQKNLAYGVIAKVEEKTSPFNARFDVLKEKQTHLNTSMESLRKTKEAGQKGLREFEAALQNKNLDIGERAMLKIKVEGIKDCIKRIDAEYKANQKSMLGVAKKMNAVNLRLGKWNVFKNEYARVGANRRYVDAGPASKEAQEKNRDSTYSHAPEPLERTIEQQPQTQTAPDGPGGPPDTPESKEKIISTTPEEYIKRWEKELGDNPDTEKVDPHRFITRFGIDPATRMQLKDIEFYFKKLLEKDVTKGKAIYLTQGNVVLTESVVLEKMKNVRRSFEKEK